jgi:hypothetical protein
LIATFTAITRLLQKIWDFLIDAARPAQFFSTGLTGRHARLCAGHPRPDAVENINRYPRQRRVDSRDKPGHDVRCWRDPRL